MILKNNEDARLQLIILEDDLEYSCTLTSNDVIALMGLPYKITSSGTPGKRSYRILPDSKIGVYRLGDNLDFSFDENKKEILTITNFKWFSKELSDIFKSLKKGEDRQITIGKQSQNETNTTKSNI